MRPQPNDYPTYFGNYINQVKEDNIIEAFDNQDTVLNTFLESIPEEKWDYAYADGKWTIKELVQHLADGERVFEYRALCMARKDKTSLPPFEEDDYAKNSNAGKRTKRELVDEFLAVRRSSSLLFKSFDEEMLNEVGISNDKPVSVLSIGYIIIGHFNHHKRVIEERYLS